MVKLEELLETLVSRGGSDLHLSAGSPPKIRLDGNLVDESPEPLGHEDTKQIVYSILTNDQIATFEEKLELDLSFGVSGLGRFRTNVFPHASDTGIIQSGHMIGKLNGEIKLQGPMGKRLAIAWYPSALGEISKGMCSP